MANEQWKSFIERMSEADAKKALAKIMEWMRPLGNDAFVQYRPAGEDGPAALFWEATGDSILED
jgi:hypothetical protein